MSKNSRLVYATDQGRIRTQTDTPAPVTTGDGIVRLLRETKGRKGKGVTLIKGLPLAPEDLKKLAKQLKQQCGVGGALKDNTIEIQTDNREKLKQILENLGHKVKIAGG